MASDDLETREALAQRAEAVRRRLLANKEALEYRLRPSTIAHTAMHALRARADAAAHQARRFARDHRVALGAGGAVAATGAAAVAIRNRRASAGPETTGTDMTNSYPHANIDAERLQRAARNIREPDGAAPDAPSSPGWTIERAPLTTLAVAAGAGLAIGLLLTRTRLGEQLLGGIGDRLRDVLDEATAVAQQAGQRALGELESSVDYVHDHFAEIAADTAKAALIALEGVAVKTLLGEVINRPRARQDVAPPPAA